jgi:hypothetical protein
VRRLSAAALVIAGVAGAGRLTAQSVPNAPSRESVTGAAHQIDLLEKRVELATGDQFYVVVDPNANKLVLMLHGAILRDYPIEALQVGTPRVVFRQRHLADHWQGRVWTEGALVPARDIDRIEIVPPDSSKADSVQTFKPPPLPEEMYPVPARYHVRYTGGLSIEVRPHELDATSLGWSQRVRNSVGVWYRDLRAAMAENPEDVLRLRIVMQPEHAASFYRALPPSTRLLILPRS